MKNEKNEINELDIIDFYLSPDNFKENEPEKYKIILEKDRNPEFRRRYLKERELFFEEESEPEKYKIILGKDRNPEFRRKYLKEKDLSFEEEYEQFLNAQLTEEEQKIADEVFASFKEKHFPEPEEEKRKKWVFWPSVANLWTSAKESIIFNSCLATAGILLGLPSLVISLWSYKVVYESKHFMHLDDPTHTPGHTYLDSSILLLISLLLLGGAFYAIQNIRRKK